MTGKQVSAEQVKVIEIFTAKPQHWFGSNSIANKANIPGSTVRHLLLTFFKFGLLERTDTFGGYRYRLSPTAEEQPYFSRVREAAAVMQQQ